MILNHLKQFFTLILLLVITESAIYSQTGSSEAHINLVMRKIGSEILSEAGDNTTIVLPIEKINERYKIQFENDFQLLPSSLSNAIQRVVIETEISSKYRVEVEQCDTNIVVYGYEIGVFDSTDQIACRTRLQPKDCYIIYFTFLDQPNGNLSILPPSESTQSSSVSRTSSVFLWILFILLVTAVLVYYFFKKRNYKRNKSHIINLGKYQFDQRKMLLILRSSKVELTSKEADLLGLLYNSANETIEREEILQKVWGDEGDYVGRTLDVFISKLRKKLIADESVKIVNVRGVGYKMILDI